jgi:hypothetical protein
LKQYAPQEDPLEAHAISGESGTISWRHTEYAVSKSGSFPALDRSFGRAPLQLETNCTDPTMTPYSGLSSTIVFDAVLVASRQERRRSIASKQAPKFLRASFDDQQVTFWDFGPVSPLSLRLWDFWRSKRYLS